MALLLTSVAPTIVSLVPGTGATSTTVTNQNNTSGKTLTFNISGLTVGDTLDLYYGTNKIGEVVDVTSTSMQITTNGSFTLPAGADSITATQTLPSQAAVTVGNQSISTPLTSPSSTAYALTVDTTPPSFTSSDTSTAVTTATVNVPYHYQVTTATDAAGAVTYSLISPVSGMTINSTSGLIQWDPVAGQGPSVPVDIQATDPAGNTAQQQYTITLANTNHAPVLTAGSPASPSLGSIHLNTPLVAALSSFINNGSNTTTITDQDTGAVVGGIAVTGVVGNGTWEYSLDGKTFQSISPAGTGINGSVTSTVSSTSALLLPKNAQIEYIPNGSTAETATITYQAWDTTSGTAGGFASVTTNGSATAFSTASDTASLSVTATTDTVVLTAAHPSLGSTTKSAALTVNLSAFVNAGSGTTTINPTSGAGIAVSGFTGDGTWSFATSSGGTFTNFSSLSSSPSLSAPLLLGPTSQLKYTPNGSNSETPTLTYYGWNGTGGTSGTTGGSLSGSGATGGATNFSLTSDTASLIVNDAPVLTAAKPSLGSTTSSTAMTISLASSFINHGTGTTQITDADSNATLGGIALTGISGSGTWTYSLDGTNYISVGTPSASAALLLPSTASLRYTPDGQSETASITYSAWDQTSGTAGTTANTTTNGASTAFSTASDTASLTVNTAPVLTAATPSLGSTPANDAKTFTLASFINSTTATSTTITDADSNATLGGIALTGTTGKGTWSYELSGATSFTNVGTVAANQALLLPANATLEYTPDGTDAEAPTITYRAWDQTSGVVATTADSTADGGSTAFSTATDTATLTVTATNHAPVLTAASPSLGQTAASTAKTITVASFINNGSGTTTITDADSGAVVGGIALTGTTGTGTWAYELSGQTTFTNVGTVSTSSALLLPKDATLRYTPVAGTNESASLTYCAWDTTSGAAGSDVSTTTNGGSSAFSTVSDTATLNVGSYASLSGYVSGAWTSSNQGMGGVTIRLLLKNSAGVFTEFSAASPTQTSSTGAYSFNNLPAGTYEIEETEPNHFMDGVDTVGSINGTASGTNPTAGVFQVTLTAGQSGTGYDFGVAGVRAEQILQMPTLNMFFTFYFSMSADELMQTLSTAPSVDLAGASGSTSTDNYSATLATHSSSVAIASSSASIASPDSSTLASMIVTIANSKDGADEQLQAVTAGTPITASAYGSNGLLLTGIADVSTYQTVLQSITYSDSAASPTGGNRTIDVTVDDGVMSSAAAVSTIDVLPIGTGVTTTTVTASQSPVVFGQSVTLTATVTPSSGSATPTGTVEFTSGSVTLGTGTLDSSGVATVSTTALALGSDTVSASYTGDSKYALSSGTVAETVNQDATTTVLSGSPSSAVYGQSVTLTATVNPTAPGTGTPTGTVTFLEGSTTLGTANLDSTGKASFSTTSLLLGSDSITASYAGDTNYTTSTSTSETETISQDGSTTAVGISPTSAVSGQSLTVTATVSAGSPGSGTPTGTVTFLDGSTTLGTGTLSGGVASYTTSALSVGSATITASYGGDTNFTASSGSKSATLSQAATTTVLSVPSSSAVSGQSLTFSATVSASSPGSGTPTGTVTFLDGSTTLGTGTLASGVATFTTTAIAEGSHSITASYTGDTNFTTSTSSASSESVGQDATTTALSGPASSSAVYGQSVTFTATIAASAPGSGTPTGTVTFSDGGVSVGTGTLSGGVATFTTTSLSVASHTITASYGGDTNFTTSSSTSSVSETIGQASTSTALAASANPAVTGEPVTFTATVSATSPSSGVPTGTVTFLDGSTTLGTGTLASGVASFTSSTLAQGSHTITASYGVSTDYAASTSSSLTQTIDLVGTTASTTVVTASADPVAVNQPVTFTATVSPATGTGTPTGMVFFMNGTTTLGTGTLTTVNGVQTATFTTSSLSVGPYTVTAKYYGDITYAASSGTVEGTVDQTGTTTALVALPTSTVFGQSVTLTATVTENAASNGTLAGGTVTFISGGVTLGTGTLDDTGKASLSTAALPLGSDSITATYAGSSDFGGSTSTGQSVSVTQDGTATTLASSASTAFTGQYVVLTATVNADSPSSATPAGTLTFYDGTTSLGTGTLNSSGVATFTTTTLALGSHSITADYQGNPNFTTSNSVALTETIDQVGATATTTAVTGLPSPANFGQAVTFTATVSHTAGAAAPTGMVTFLDGTTVLGNGTVDSSGLATFSTSILSVATHTITASYSGNATYAASSGTAAEVINPVGAAATTTTLGAASPSSPVFGQSVTLSATVGPATGSGTPTGSVTFYDGSISLGTGTLTAGVATVSTTALPQGTDTITATYNGDPTYADSTSTGQSVTVAKDATTTTVTPSANPAAAGTIVFTATVGANSPGSGSPTGTVEFLDNGTSMGTGTLDASGDATLTTTLAQGSYSITADYLGDTNFATSNTSTALTEVVGTIGTNESTTVPYAQQIPGIAGQPVTLGAVVNNATTDDTLANPTGTVTFLEGTTTLGTATLDSASGQATLTTSTLPAGTDTIYADYSGDAIYAASNGNFQEPIVAATSTSTALNASDDPAVTGELVSFTATVSANAQNAGTPTGTVDFLDGTTTLGTGTLDANGVATFSTSALTVADSPYTIVANYLGDTAFTASTSATLSPLSETIQQAATSTQISASADPAVSGQSVTFTAYVAADSPGTGTPTGTVTFDDNGTSIGTGTLDASGTASFTTTTNLTAGVHSITATYGGDTNYSTSPVVTLSETVQTGTTTSLTATAGPVVYGQSVTLSATVSPASGSTTPTGTVTFLDGSTTLGSGTLTAGVATLTTTALPEGADTITASYAGNTLFTTSTSTGASETVNQDPTTMVLASSANPAVAGQYVTFTATVSPSSPGSGTPTGTVTFLDGGTGVGTGTLNSSGVAAFSTTALPQGSDSITASYAGDTNYAGSSTGTALTETVNAIGSTATTTAVTTSASTANVGTSVTFSATVSHTTGTDAPTGTVTFLDGTTVLGTGAVDTTSGIATFSTSTLPVGSSETITASYSGDANYAGSNGTTSETINALATITTLSASDNAPILTESVTLTATVGHTAGSATPSGTVTFLDGSTTLGTGTLNASGLATFSTVALPLGSDNITASYSGDSSYATSTTASPTIIVVKQETSLTTLAASANPAVSGQYVTFTVTVTAATPGTGTPTGTVNFLDGTTTLGTGTLTAGGLATFTTSALTQGVHTVTAVYQGDTDFATSTSDALTEGINQVGATATTTVLASAPTSQTVGQSVTFTATVTTATGTPTGSVTFLEGTTVLDTVTLGSNGKAIFSTSALPVGSAQTIDAIYSGDTSFASSQGTATETISGSTNSPFSPTATDAALGQDTNWLD